MELLLQPSDDKCVEVYAAHTVDVAPEVCLVAGGPAVGFVGHLFSLHYLD